MLCLPILKMLPFIKKFPYCYALCWPQYSHWTYYASRTCFLPLFLYKFPRLCPNFKPKEKKIYIVYMLNSICQLSCLQISSGKGHAQDTLNETEYTQLSMYILYGTHQQECSSADTEKNSSQKFIFTAARGNNVACHQRIEVSLHLWFWA